MCACTVVEMLEWEDAAAAERAHATPDVMAVCGPMETLAEEMDFLALVALATPAVPCPDKAHTHTATNQTETPAAQPSGAVAKADKAEKAQKSEKAKRAQTQKAAATN